MGIDRRNWATVWGYEVTPSSAASSTASQWPRIVPKFWETRGLEMSPGRPDGVSGSGASGGS